LRVSGRSFRGISFVLAFSRSVRRFGGISFPCQKILAFELLGRVLSPPLPRKVLAPRVADHNPQSQSQPNACDCLQLSLPSLYTPLISGLGPRRTPVGGAAPALKSERPLADCFKCSRSSLPLQGKQKKDGCIDTRHNTEHGSRWMFAVSLHLDPDPQRDGESLVTPDSKCELYRGTVL